MQAWGRAQLKGWTHFAALLALVWSSAVALAEDPVWRHSLSLAGAPRYAADFRHTDYVNPGAPKGGRIRLGALGTFDNLNPLVSGVKGKLASHLMLIYEPLLMASLDEPTTEYGLLAEAVSHPDDFSSVSFRLRPEARWADGEPVTAADVAFSYAAWKKLSPQWRKLLNRIADVEILSEREIRFRFVEAGDPSLPLYIGQMSILPRHWWEGVDAAGQRRDIESTTLEPPLGSGAYAVRSVTPGRAIIYERNAHYWGRNVPIKIGTDNFNRIEIEYFRDPNVMFEAFKADHIDMRRETSLKSWTVSYGFTAATDGRVAREAFPIERLGIVKAFVFNLRRPKFADPRVRKALALAYGFDGINRNLFHGLLAKPASYFPQTDFEATGPLSAQERGLLAQLPGAPDGRRLHAAALAGKAEGARSNLYNALELLKEAGYRLKGDRLLDRSGEQLSLEFVLEDPGLERVAAAYASQLAKIGVAAAVRVVDDVQYQNRLRTFDFDMAAHAWVQGHAPGSEQREYWTTASAGQRGTNNLAGISSPLVDALVERLVLAPSRTEKVASGRLLDRILRDMAFGVPIMNEDREFMARWDRFGRPPTMPRYGATAFPSIWWWDDGKAAKVGGRNIDVPRLTIGAR